MRRVIVKLIGDGTPKSPYRPELKLGETHFPGEIIISEIETTPAGKPKKREIEIVIT